MSETNTETGEVVEKQLSVEVELPVNWTEDGNAVCYVTYEHNDVINTLHCPAETWHSGKHILSFFDFA